MKKKILTTEILIYENSENFTKAEIALIGKAKEAVKRAYAPYSQFFVGASVLLKNGEIISGNNQENAAYPSGLCAERVALFYANSLYPDVAVEALAVTVFTKNDFLETPAPPCGACRQVMLETEIRFKTPMKIFLVGKKQIYVIENAKSLLPIHFDKDLLE